VLLFSSNGRGGTGGFDLFAARRHQNEGFESASPLPGEVNTVADEFDATFLADGATVVFARSLDLQVETVHLFHSFLQDERYDTGTMLPDSVNASDKDTYGPMLDWSCANRITFSGERHEAHTGSTDVYVIRYRLMRDHSAGSLEREDTTPHSLEQPCKEPPS
jgi:hypothetical protein